MQIKIATWNMDHWKRTPAQRRAAWEQLKAWGFDIVLLQECVPPGDLPRDRVIWREIGRTRRFGSAVLCLQDDWAIEELVTAKSCHSFESLPLNTTFPGSVIVARVQPPGCEPITVVSVYSVIDVYSTTTVLRQVADLMPLFDSVHGQRVVVGGDFNISTQSTGDELVRAQAAFRAIESLRLVDLFAHVPDRPRGSEAGAGSNGDGGYHVVTHRNANPSVTKGRHLDYLFATPSLADRTTRLRLMDGAETWELSDHCPVVAEIDLAPTASPAAWEPRYADDVAEQLRAVLGEPRDWGVVWAPGSSRPVVRTDRELRRWIAAFWEGRLVDGRPAQLEAGMWRDEAVTGRPLVAYVGLLAKPMGAKLAGLSVPMPDEPARIVGSKDADYYSIAMSDGSLPGDAFRELIADFVARVSLSST